MVLQLIAVAVRETKAARIVRHLRWYRNISQHVSNKKAGLNKSPATPIARKGRGQRRITDAASTAERNSSPRQNGSRVRLPSMINCRLGGEVCMGCDKSTLAVSGAGPHAQKCKQRRSTGIHSSAFVGLHLSCSRCGWWSRFHRTRAASVVSRKANSSFKDSMWPSQKSMFAFRWW